jgi:hypothetical protein
MPLEGHWERQHGGLASIGRRERNAIVAGLAALVATGAIVAAGAVGRGAPDVQAGCVDLVVPSTTGAATLHACGAAAQRWCRSPAGRPADAAATCRRAGL